MDYKIDLSPGEQQQDFVDQLQSAIRKLLKNYTGEAGRRADGKYVSTVQGIFLLDEGPVLLTWTLIYSANGAIETVRVESSHPNPSGWQSFTTAIVTEALAAALRKGRNTYFRRVCFLYVGEALDGEYWLPGFRLAPLLPNDESPCIVNAERAIVVDMNVLAIDEAHAASIAIEKAKRHIARISFFLGISFYGTENVERWVIERLELGKPPIRRRLPRSFPEMPIQTEMPKKKQLCELGKGVGKLGSTARFWGEQISLPQEARRIFRYLDTAGPEIRDAFDACARLLQVALHLEGKFPSASLAYRVAALDAVSGANGRRKELATFFKSYVAERDDLDQIFEYLWGTVRNGHFHGGEFPLGEYSAGIDSSPFLSSIETDSYHRQDLCKAVIREAIVN